MNKLVQLCLGVIGIPFLIVGISYVTKNTHTLPVTMEQACVYEIVQSGTTFFGPKGIGSYRKDGVWITAYHVVDECRSDCYLRTASGNVLLRDIRRLKTGDSALFRISSNDICITADRKTSFVTIVSGVVTRLPVVIRGNTIDVEVSYGQSGSPVYQDGELVGVVSQRAQGYSLIERVP